PGNGTAVISGGQIIYTPAPGFTGTDSFTYTVSDGRGGTSTATVTVRVNAAPVAADDSYTVQRGSSNNALNVLANDTDPNSDPLTITAVSAPGNGTAVISGDQVLYTPT